MPVERFLLTGVYNTTPVKRKPRHGQNISQHGGKLKPPRIISWTAFLFVMKHQGKTIFGTEGILLSVSIFHQDNEAIKGQRFITGNLDTIFQ